MKDAREITNDRYKDRPPLKLSTESRFDRTGHFFRRAETGDRKRTGARRGLNAF